MRGAQMTGSTHQLIHFAYTSILAPERTAADLLPILTKARRTNAGLQATGILCCHQRSFFQVLEGPRQQIDDLYRADRTRSPSRPGDPAHARADPRALVPGLDDGPD